MSDAPGPLTPISFMYNKIITKDENDKFNFSLKFNEQSYNCSLNIIKQSIIKFILISAKNSLLIYENEFDLSSFQMLNRNFKIYEDINEIKNDLIGYIKKNNLKINEINEKEIHLQLQIIANKDNIVNLTMNKKEIKEKDKLSIVEKELDNKNMQINELKKKINEIEKKNEILKKELNEEILNKDKKILELEKRLEKLEKMIENTQNKNLTKQINKLEIITKKLNIKYLNKEIKTFKVNRPINDVCLFPESGYFMESSGPSIYDKNLKFVKTFTELGFCDHITLIKEKLIALSQKNTLLILKINDIEEDKYQIETLTDLHEDNIKKIIKGLNEDEIITCDIKGNIKFFKIIIKDNFININYINSITPHINDKIFSYIFLIQNILIVSNDKLYFYDIINSESSKTKNPPYYNAMPLCWNAFTAIDKSKDNLIVGIGCDKKTIILQIKSVEDFKKIKEIKINSENTSHEALCLYQKEFLIIGLKNGNIHIFDIINNYELIRSIYNAHSFNKIASINGITELSDGSFASYGEDGIIKIW